MRVTRVIVATTMLMGAAAPAWACELDGPGGHRFFAFANMYRGGQAEPPAQSREQPAPAKSEESERDRQGGNGGSDPAGSNPSGSAPQDAAPSR